MEQGSSFHYDGGGVLQHNRTEIWFPPMVSSQGALPNVRPPSVLVRTSSLGTPSSAWMPLQSSSYSSGLPLHAPRYASQMPPK